METDVPEILTLMYIKDQPRLFGALGRGGQLLGVVALFHPQHVLLGAAADLLHLGVAGVRSAHHQEEVGVVRGLLGEQGENSMTARSLLGLGLPGEPPADEPSWSFLPFCSVTLGFLEAMRKQMDRATWGTRERKWPVSCHT